MPFCEEHTASSDQGINAAACSLARTGADTWLMPFYERHTLHCDEGDFAAVGLPTGLPAGCALASRVASRLCTG